MLPRIREPVAPAPSQRPGKPEASSPTPDRAPTALSPDQLVRAAPASELVASDTSPLDLAPTEAFVHGAQHLARLELARLELPEGAAADELDLQRVELMLALEGLADAVEEERQRGAALAEARARLPAARAEATRALDEAEAQLAAALDEEARARQDLRPLINLRDEAEQARAQTRLEDATTLREHAERASTAAAAALEAVEAQAHALAALPGRPSSGLRPEALDQADGLPAQRARLSAELARRLESQGPAGDEARLRLAQSLLAGADSPAAAAAALQLLQRVSTPGLEAARVELLAQVALRAGATDLALARRALQEAETLLAAAPGLGPAWRARLGEVAALVVLSVVSVGSRAVAAFQASPDALDELHQSAQRLLAEAAADAPGRRALALLADALLAVPETLEVAARELEAGRRRAGALVRSQGRQEARLETAKHSVLVKPVLYGIRKYQGAPELDTAQAEVSDRRVAELDRATRRQIEGAGRVREGYEAARREGRPLRFLASLWALAASGPGSAAATERARARQSLPAGSMAFVEVAFVRREVPASSLLAEGLDLEGGVPAPRVATTAEMVELGIQPSVEAAQAAREGASAVLITNAALEGMLSVIVSGGAAATAAYARVAQAAQLARLAALPPAAAAALSHVGAGAALLGVGYGARRLFGEQSAIAESSEHAAGWLPIGIAHRVAGLRALLPTLAVGGAQSALTAAVVPEAAEALELRGELSQLLLGVVVGGLASGAVGVAASGLARGGSGARVDEALAKVLGDASQASPSARRQLALELRAFLRRSGGEMPSRAELLALRQRLLVALGGGGPGARTSPALAVEVAVETLSVRLAVERGLAGRAIDELSGAERLAAFDAAAAHLLGARGEGLGPEAWARARSDVGAALRASLGSPSAAPKPGQADHHALIADWTFASVVVAGVPGAAAGPAPAAGALDRRAQVVLEALPELRAQARSPERGGAAPAALRQRLERELGLSPAEAADVVGLAQVATLEAVAVERLRTLQAVSNVRLSTAEVAALVHELALRLDLPEAAAGRFANALTGSARFEAKWSDVRPAGVASPAEHRRAFLDALPAEKRALMSQLDVHEFTEVFGPAGVPFAAIALADVPGFVTLAKDRPEDARTLISLESFHPGAAAHILAATPGLSLSGLAKFALDYLPQISPHPTHPDYVVVRRGPQSPAWVPEVSLQPTRALDHNGAFHVPGAVGRQGRSSDEPKLLPPVEIDRLGMAPQHLVVDGQPMQNLDGVLVFGGHGSPNGISGLRPGEVADMIVQQILQHPDPSALRGVVLSACHQRDRRSLGGPSSAQLIQREVEARLRARGMAPVKVYAADHAGPIWVPVAHPRGPVYRAGTRLSWGRGDGLARFTEADYARMTDQQRALLLAGGLSGAAVTAAAAWLYERSRGASEPSADTR